MRLRWPDGTWQFKALRSELNAWTAGWAGAAGVTGAAGVAATGAAPPPTRAVNRLSDAPASFRRMRSSALSFGPAFPAACTMVASGILSLTIRISLSTTVAGWAAAGAAAFF